MPAINDVLRVAVKFLDIDNQEVFNIFHFTIDSLSVNTWEAVGDDLKVWFEDGYSDWLGEVSNQWFGNSFEILVRDAGAGQWNQVYTDVFDSLNGQLPEQSYPALSCATYVSYPGSVRHWGFKNLPSPSDNSASGGRIEPTALASLLITGALLSTGVIGVDTVLRVGVYSLLEETFRGFTGNIAASDVVGSRVTRKANRGI